MDYKHFRKVSFFVAVLGMVVSGQENAFADSFLSPARNGYSLDKTFERPFLQNAPVPQVWQTDSSSEDFKRALLDAKMPVSLQERQFNSFVRYADKSDALQDFQSIIIDDRNSEENVIADLLNKLVPIVVAANDLTMEEIEQINRKYAEYRKEADEKEIFAEQNRLFDLDAFFKALKETVKIDLDLEILKNKLKKEVAAENEILKRTSEGFLPEGVLDKAGDVYSTETVTMQGMRETDETIWSLLVNDLLDLSTGTDMFLYDETYTNDDFLENKPRSASLLDSRGKTDQIHEDNLFSKKKAIIQRMGNIRKNN